jgi:hypothetical protein
MEFIGKQVKTYLKDLKIVQSLTSNEVKANYAERCIKTIKTRMYRYFTHKQTYTYVDKLQDFADSYNNTVHRSIKRAPAQVNAENAHQVWFDLYALPLMKKSKDHKEHILKVGELVRITYLRSTFHRAYYHNYTGEVFRITKVLHNNTIHMYRLIDYNNREIKGQFYYQELQPVTIDENKPYKIERILKRRTRRGIREALVRWAFWPSDYDLWVPEDTLQDI